MSMKLDFLSIKHKKYHNTKAPSVTKSGMNRKVLDTHVFLHTILYDVLELVCI